VGKLFPHPIDDNNKGVGMEHTKEILLTDEEKTELEELQSFAWLKRKEKEKNE